MKVLFEVQIKDVFDLLVSALEGGSNYWYDNLKVIGPPPEKTTANEVACTELGLDWDNLTNSFYRAIFIGKGCTVTVEYFDGTPLVIDLTRLYIAMDLFARKSPLHFSNFISGQWDAETADVFFQYVVLDDLIFG